MSYDFGKKAGDTLCDMGIFDPETRVATLPFEGFGRAYVPVQRICDIYAIEKSLVRGTVFPELDEPYRPKNKGGFKKSLEKIANADLVIDLTDKSRHELLQKLTALDFALLDMGLYLNVNPCDSRALAIHRELACEAKKIRELYENTFGPLTTKKELADGKWDWKWACDPWPWDIEANFKIKEA